MTITYNALKTTGELYYFSFNSLGSLYSQGLITEEEKQKIVDIGHKYWSAHQAAVSALALYERTRQAPEKQKVETALREAQKLYGEFVDLIQPFLKRRE